MNAFLVKLQYQGDDRVEDVYSAYSNIEDEDELEGVIIALPEFDNYETDCIDTWMEEDDDPDDVYVSVKVELLTEEEVKEYGSWFTSLPIIYDER